MKIKKLLENEKDVVVYYALKDDKGVVFYNNEGREAKLPQFNKCIDYFILNSMANVLICLKNDSVQLSDLLVDYFPDNDLLDENALDGLIYIVLH